jgi:UDPglucose 6-dehydrogenase
MNNAAVIGGLGTVGRATRLAFGIDKYFDLKGSTISLKEAAVFRYVFICLPTPTHNGNSDIHTIEEVIRQIEKENYQPIYIIRSTVLPGTADRLMNETRMDRVVSNPEFLTESRWEEDAVRPDLAIIGANNKQYANEVKGMYDARYKYMEAQVTNNTTAELVKYAFNTFYATKVIFANQIYDVAKRIGADYEFVKNVMLPHKWVGSNHLDVHHSGYRGVGGKCLEKDLEAFTPFSKSPILHTVREINRELRRSK